MPIYEYRCEGCGETSELLQAMSAPAPERCPACGGLGPLTKLLSLTNVRRHVPTRQPGHTCCGRSERCDEPPCQPGGRCCSS